jgi:uncharacterized protein YbgA (DUF1722 family)/uncharacterized protein YbbK (DUF523 family)
MSQQAQSQSIGPRPKLGISSCLLGQQVRFDGGHKHNKYLTSTLGEHFDFVSYCPEVAIGLSTPRPPIRLTAIKSKETGGDAELIHAVRTDDISVDHTSALDDYAGKVSTQLEDFSGYIVKKDSPSCGMERVKVYGKENAPPVRRGTGIFTARLLRERPELPVEEEGRLMDPRLRENFITRVFTMFRWREMVADGLSKSSLVAFHTRHKFLIMAHHEVTYRKLGQLIANIAGHDLEVLAREYIVVLMQGLRNLASPGKHANVLMHIMGFIKGRMSADEKSELLDLIDTHRNGLVPIVVPVTLLNHFLRRYPHEYIDRQYFLEPHPRELMLRNHI